MGKETVAIIGASNKQNRYSYKALHKLLSAGHKVIPINPKYSSIDSMTCYPNLESCNSKIDTITVYVRPDLVSSLTESIINAAPKRVIFNPGSENRAAIKQIENAGVDVEAACTLALLSMSQF